MTSNFGARWKYRANPNPTIAPTTVSMRCPHCRQMGAFQATHADDAAWHFNAGARIGDFCSAGVRYCPNRACEGIIFVLQRTNYKPIFFPPETIDFDSSNLPELLQSTLEEAIACHAAGAYRASALMVRRLLEELCADRGAKGANLKKRIEALAGTITVSTELLEAADELRVLGNDAAHIEAEVYEKIGPEEAELALVLAKELVKAVYQMRDLVERLKALRKAES